MTDDLRAFRRLPHLAALADRALSTEEVMWSLRLARRDTWDELLSSLALMHLAEPFSPEELVEFLDDLRDVYGSGFSKLWDRMMPADAQHAGLRTTVKERARRRLLAEIHKPNGPNERTWLGRIPAQRDDPMPQYGQPVVYMLYGPKDGNTAAYIGSTDQFWTRIRRHEQDKPGLSDWTAILFATRDQAYAAEDNLLKQRMPRLNRKRGR